MRFIEDFRVVGTGQIWKLFYNNISLRNCQRRLRMLVDAGKVNRFRASISSEYLYCLDVGKIKQIEHSLKRVDFYIACKEKKLVDFVPEFQFAGVRCDAYFEVWQDGVVYPAFLEVQRSVGFKLSKYERLYISMDWKNKWEHFPLVVLVADKKVKVKTRVSGVRYVILDWDNIDINILLEKTKTDAFQTQSQGFFE